MQIDKAETFYPENKRQWRSWLKANHLKKDFVWLIQYNKKSEKPTISWSDAVDEALCYGWIDSTRKKLDDESTIQYFSKRKIKSTWSRINKEKVEKLTELNLMAPAGLQSVQIAKGNGSWELLDSVEALIIPADLEKALRTRKAMRFFMSLSKSVRKAMLHRIQMAKKEETRAKRINEIIEFIEKESI